MNPEDIYKDLMKVVSLEWQVSAGFGEVKLLDLDVVARRAADPGVRSALVRALEGLFKQTVTRLKAQEKLENVDEGHSVGLAASILFRLREKPDRRSLRAVRQEVGEGWIGKRGHSINGETFRQHYERPAVLRPFANELHRLLLEPAEGSAPTKESKGSGSRSSLGSKERQMLEHLEKIEETRLAGVREEGKLQIRAEPEMLEILRKVNRLARRSLKAVDRTPILHWTENGSLKAYLKEQLELVERKKLSLERIYVFAPAILKNANERELLVQFVQRHEAASATVLLCPARVAKANQSKSFPEDRGMILADSDKDPLAVTGKLMDGEIGEAFLFTREQTDIEAFREQYNLLRERILTRNYDEQAREELGLVTGGD